MTGSPDTKKAIRIRLTGYSYSGNTHDRTLDSAFADCAVHAFMRGFRKIAVGLFLFDWVFQFVGHAFEGRPPEFFKDWRFLLVGLRWWLKQLAVPSGEAKTYSKASG